MKKRNIIHVNFATKKRNSRRYTLSRRIYFIDWFSVFSVIWAISAVTMSIIALWSISKQ